MIPHDHDRPLVDAGILIRALVFDQVVDIHPCIPGSGGAIGLDHNARRVLALHHPIPHRHDRYARIPRHHLLHPGADQRRLGAQQGNSLALHVRTHERAVGIIVFQKGDERGRHAHQLVGRDVHEVDLVRPAHDEFSALTGRDEIDRKVAPAVERRVGLSDDMILLLQGREITDPICHPPAFNFAIGGLDKTELVHSGVSGQRGDQPNVGAFRGLDRAHSAVVGRMDVAHLKASALAREAAGTERR